MGDATKAAATRWLAEHVGQELETKQVRPNGMVWGPGRRTLRQDGRVFRLDGSRIGPWGRDHVINEVEPDHIRVELIDDDGVTVHWTIYSVVEA